MKKFWLLVFVLVVVLALGACGGNDDNNGNGAADPPPIDVVEADPPVDTNDGGEEDLPPDANDNDDDGEIEWPPVIMPAGITYSMRDDSYIQGLAVGTMGDGTLFDGTPFLRSAGSPVFGIVEGPGGSNAVRLTFRGENWHALDIDVFHDLDLANNSYHIMVEGHFADPGATVVLSGPDGPWNHLFTTVADSDGYFTIEGIISTAALEGTGSIAQFDRGFRIQNANDPHNDLTVFDIRIVVTDDVVEVEIEVEEEEEVVVAVEEEEEEEEVVVAVVEPPAPAGGAVIYSLATDGAFQGIDLGSTGPGSAILGPTAVLMDAGPPHFTIIDNPLGAGHGFTVSNRSYNWHAVDVRIFAEELIDGVPADPADSFTITVRGSTTPGHTVVIGATHGPWNWLDSATVGADGRFAITTVLSPATMAALDGPATQFTNGGFRIMTADGEVDNYNVYEIVVTRN
jgi:hypothetical protein